MSASREKKKRQDQTEPEVVQAKKGLGNGAKKALITVVAVVLVAAIVFLGMVSTGFFVKHTTAVTIGNHKLTPAMVNYFFGDAYASLQQNMGQLFTMMIDTSKPLDEQEYMNDDFDTWSDYLTDAALNTAADAYAIYDEAMNNGFTLSEEAVSGIDSSITLMSTYAAAYGYPNADSFLNDRYGSGCTVKSYREYVELTTTVREYSTSILSDLTYTQDEINAYYAEHTEDFDAVDYRVYNITTDIEEPTDEDLAALEDAAKVMAEASKGDETIFLEIAQENTPEEKQENYNAENATIRKDYTKEEAAELYRDWLFDASRQAGDTTYMANENGNGYSVLYFIGQTDHSYVLPNVRHILTYVDDATDETAMTEAQVEADGILGEFLAGAATEASFAKLADEKSDDTPVGGLVENLAHGKMPQECEDWAYEESRQVGDTAVVKSDYGYHVMYFSGYGMTFQDYTVDNAIRGNDYNDWYASVTENMTYSTNGFSMHFVNN